MPTRFAIGASRSKFLDLLYRLVGHASDIHDLEAYYRTVVLNWFTPFKE